MKIIPFEALLNSTHTFIVPDAIANSFINSGYKRVIVVLTFNDNTITFHAALQKYHNQYHITFNKQNQKTLGVTSTDYFIASLTPDNSKYGVEMPEEFEAVLQSDLDALRIFESLTDGKKRILIYYILKIKNSQNRIDKALLITENLKRGIRDQRELIRKFI